MKEWRFDPSSKLEFLDLIESNKGVRRDLSKGINPLQICSRPFTKYRNQISFHIKEIGTWLRVGVVDRKVKLNNGDLIGDQEDCFNIGYCRSGSISFSGANFESIEDHYTRLEAGNFICIKWDSYKNCFSFFVNNSLKKVVKVNSQDIGIIEGNVYPCVQISWHSYVTIVEPDFMELEGE